MYKVLLTYSMLVLLPLLQAAAFDHSQCTSCHLLEGDPELVQPLPYLCISCHMERVGEGEHVINVEPESTPVPALPLLNGVIGCSTCHDPHATSPGQLRLSIGQMCWACHKL